MENKKRNAKVITTPFVTITRSEKGILFTPSADLMTAFGLPINSTFHPASKKEKPYLVGKPVVKKRVKK